MKRVIRILIILLVVAGVAAGGYWLYQTRIAPAPTAATTFTQVVPVREGTLSDRTSVVGELDAESSQDLVFSYLDGAANLEALMVAAGNDVKAGQVLAKIDPASYQQELDQAKSDLQAAEKALADLKAPATALALAEADLAIAQANYQQTEAKNTLDELQNPDMAELQRAVDDARVALAQAQSDLVAQENDETAEKDLYDLQVAEATPAAEYNRLASETYSDEFYQDRLRVAYNNLMNARDALETFQIQQQADLLTAKTTIRTAEQTLAQAQQDLKDAQSGGNKLDLTQATLAVQAAQVALEAAKDARAALDDGADEADLAVAQADVDKKRLAVTNAEKALAGTELKAPFDGTILETNVRAGDQLTANTVVLTIADLTQLQVVAAVDETTIRRIKEGQTAQISFDAFPGQTFKGTVLAIPLQGALQNDVTVYQVPLSLEGIEELPVRVGMTANVDIETAQAANALLVPAIALERVRGGYQVQVVNPADPQGEPIPTPVEVGLSDGAFTQIMQGLKAGDQVVVTIQADSNQPGFQFGGAGFRIQTFPGAGGGFPGGGAFPGNNRTNRQPGGGNTTRP